MLEQLTRVIDNYKKLFTGVGEAAWDEAEQVAIDHLQERMAAGDTIHTDVEANELSEAALSGMKKALLDFLSSAASAAPLQRSMEWYREQIEAGRGVYCLPDGGPALQEAQIQMVHDAYAIWQSLPQVKASLHFDLVSKAAKQFKANHTNADFSELMGIGSEALLRAANKHDQQGDFATFALRIIREQLRTKGRTTSSSPVPLKTRKKLEKLEEARRQLEVYDNSQRSKQQLAESLSLSEGEMDALTEVESIWGTHHSMVAIEEQEDFDVPDVSPSALAMLITEETSQNLSHAMTELSDKERTVIHCLYFRNLSFSQTAQEMGVTVKSIKKHHRRAMELLQDGLDG